jgi:hypothetical protein
MTAALLMLTIGVSGSSICVCILLGDHHIAAAIRARQTSGER